MTATERDIAPPDERECAYRDAVLDAAEGVFAASGYAGAKMADVAKAARISLASLYGRWADKMGLYRAVHGRRLAELMARVRAVEPDPADVLGPMLAGMRAYVRFHMEHPRYLQMHLREGTSWSGPGELLSPEQIDAWAGGLRRMARAFERGMDAGLFVRDDAELCARTVNALHQVALAHWHARGMREAPAAVLARLDAQFVRTFCTPERVPSLLATLETT